MMKLDESTVNRMIGVLEENRMPKKDNRFKLLRDLYLLQENFKTGGEPLTMGILLKHVGEVNRLHKIGTPQEVIYDYINNISKSNL